MVTKAFTFPRSQFIGFDHIWDEIQRLSNGVEMNTKSYPPHNVVRHTDDTMSIELALAGYKKEDLVVEVSEGILHVSCEGASNLADELDREYIHRGISSKRFHRTFRLSEHVVVDGADFVDGLLVIKLKVVVPEEKRPKKINIS